ncbi:MAG: aldo/keto reductase [Oscillospiraceae bacterium]|nr:aldo/keto reductase [Oscillospiraceae bacterium]
MIYNDFQKEKLSALGFGAMRLPLCPDGEIDQAELDRMVDAAMAAGVNYFDTAYPYHGGKSESALGQSLRRYPRESWNLADKFPGHQNVHGVKPLKPEEVFEEQLVRCGVDYFDFYLLHNINENSMSYYGNPDNHFMEYFLEQKAKGRIRHLGFSCHAAPSGLEKFLSLYGEHMEFCQIQLNFVDWKLQDAEQKVAILRKAGIPVWVMEPVRGGKLARYSDDFEARMRALRPDESTPAWAFRWLRTVPKPTVVLSGMSNLAQMQDNLKTFAEDKPLNDEELALLEEIRRSLARMIPCTGCRYCCAGCPMELEIPTLLSMANDMAVDKGNFNTVARYTALGEGKRADACIGCGQCADACPQKIDVPEEMIRLADLMGGLKTWEEICKEREAAAEALKKAKAK